MSGKKLFLRLSSFNNVLKCVTDADAVGYSLMINLPTVFSLSFVILLSYISLGKFTKSSTVTFSNTSPQMFQDMIIELVVNAIEKSRDEFEAAVFQNELELLENISTSIKHTK